MAEKPQQEANVCCRCGALRPLPGNCRCPESSVLPLGGLRSPSPGRTHAHHGQASLGLCFHVNAKIRFFYFFFVNL